MPVHSSVLATMEQRRTQRFPLVLPIEITQIAGRRVSRPGETINVGSNGVLFSTPKAVEVNGRLEYIITLIDGKQKIRIKCLGHVVRVQQPAPQESAGRWIVAVTLDRYEYLRSGL